MSRSNPVRNDPNPATRRFEWDGESGNVRYYYKDAKENVVVKDGFTFILLDETSAIKGYNEPAGAGIYSNEVRDTRQEVFVVKMFDKARTKIAEGHYQDIKDRVVAKGGKFTTVCYIAFRGAEGLQIGTIQFKGAALGAWMEFKKGNRKDMYEQAVKIKGFDEAKKGKITYRTPVFHLSAEIGRASCRERVCTTV